MSEKTPDGVFLPGIYLLEAALTSCVTGKNPEKNINCMNNDQKSSGRAAGALFMMQPVNGIFRFAADTDRPGGGRRL